MTPVERTKILTSLFEKKVYDGLVIAKETMQSEQHFNTKKPQLPQKNVLRMIIAGLCVGAVGLGIAARGDSLFGHGDAGTAPPASHKHIDVLAGQFGYMPGVSKVLGQGGESGNGLTITGLDRRIVEQDGTGGQLNPPVNQYGTHLDMVGDFTITATVSDTEGASLQFYSNPPVVMDEFRVEPPSVRLTINDGKLQVDSWQGDATSNLTSQKPNTTQSFDYTHSPNIDLTFERRGDVLNIAVNKTILGFVPEDKIFDSGHIWFGMNALPGKPWQLSALSADITTPDLPEISKDSASLEDKNVSSQNSDTGLQHLASIKRPGFLIGSAVSLGPLVSDPQYRAMVLGGNLGQITIENALKWQNVAPTPTGMSFDEGDALVDFANSHHITVNGHAGGAYGESLPAWVLALPTNTPAEKKHVGDVLDNHITQLLNHFKGKISSWDIVNEPFADYDTFDPQKGAIYRDNIWYRALGPDYIAKAFTTAHRVDPSAHLYLNDFGLEDDDDRWNALFGLVQDLKKKGVPIYGVGFEAHVYDISTDKIDPQTLQARMKKLADIGVKSRISEQDVDDSAGHTAQADQYASTLAACLTEPSCESYSTWGLYDKYDLYQERQKDGTYTLQQGHDLLYDDKGGETPALAALRRILTM